MNCRTCSHWQECHCHGLQLAFQVLLYINSLESFLFKLLEPIARVGTSETRDQKVHGSNPDCPGLVKSSFFKGHGRHVHFFLLLPNDTGAPCLGGIHIVHSLKLTNVQCTETWVSPCPEAASVLSWSLTLLI